MGVGAYRRNFTMLFNIEKCLMIRNFLVQFLVILFYDIFNPVCGVQLAESMVVFSGYHASLYHMHL